MPELLTAVQMRAIEQAAIDSGAVTGLELMERAGKGVVEAIFEEWPELAKVPHRAVVLCGPGNNGGDGFVVARLLKELGWEVEVFLYGDPEKLPPDARSNYERWKEQGEVHSLSSEFFTDLNNFQQITWDLEPCLVVDALFGTGLSLSREMPHVLLDIANDFVNLRVTGYGATEFFVVSVDVPSGLCGDSGRVLIKGESVVADLTVTFHAAKLGHVLHNGPETCGKVTVKSIGIEGV